MPSSNAFEHIRAQDLEHPLSSRFEWQVDRGPGRTAIATDAGTVCYADLDRRANQVAHAVLARIGAEPAPVALFFRQGTAAVVAILGALKARKFYVPLDPRASAAESTRVLGESGAPLLLCDRTDLDRARELAAGSRVDLIDIDGCESGFPHARPDLPIAPDDLAYVFYTSGSTGRPKGVCDTHRNVSHNVLRYTNSLHLCARDRLTLIQACTFSGTVSSAFGALLNGACLLPFDFQAATPAQLADWMERSRPTVYHSVPAIFRSLFVAGPRSFPDVRIIRLEGDRASPADLALHRTHFPRDCLLVNGLGTTETGLVAQHFVSTGDPERPLVVPVGRAVEGVALRVVDEHGQPCPAGTVGEIEVSSRFLASGYWKQPELTRKHFHDDPQGGPGSRSYRTGDVGRFRPDGCLEHLGRLDTRVKLLGQWAELAEIEAALQEIPGVREAAVIAHGGPSKTRLTAYLVPASAGTLSISSVRRALGERLPRSRIPGHLVWLDALPLTASGKLDRAALPDPVTASPKREVLGPRSLLELRLVEIWQRILELEPVGVRDDFFDLGGDSLGALLLIDEIEREFGRQVSPSVLLEAGTVEELAAVLRDSTNVQPLVELQRGDGGEPFYFFHGDYLSGGLYCRALARHVGQSQSFYTVTPLGLTDALPHSYEAMARHYVEILRAHAPQGPYRLGGNCNGGLIAFEVARLLEAEGETVDRLVLVSASAANVRLAWLRAVADTLGRAILASPESRLALFRRLRAFLLRLEALPRRRRIAAALREIVKVPRAFADLALSSRRIPDQRRDAGEFDAQRLQRAYHEIDAAYVPQRYRGPIWLIWPDLDPEPAELAARRWHAVADSVELRRVPGTHTTCLTQHVDELAERIRACLA